MEPNSPNSDEEEEKGLGNTKPILFNAEKSEKPEIPERLEKGPDSSSPTKPSSKLSFSQESKHKLQSGNVVFVCIKLVEVNLLKVRSMHEVKKAQQGKPGNETNAKKRDYAFPISKDDVEASKFLKTHHLPDENIIEIPIPVNIHIPYPSFDAMQKLIEGIVEKEKKNAEIFPLEINTKNSVELFMAACLMQLEDLAYSIYEVFIKPRLSVKLLVGMLLVALEGNLTKLFMEFFRIFREYWMYKSKLAPQASELAGKLYHERNDGTRVEHENDMFCVYYKDRLEFAFPVIVLKRPFEIFRKELFKLYYKPDPKYYVLRIQRQRTMEDDDGIEDNRYPHHYFMVNQQTNEVLCSAIREKEYGDFYIFGESEGNYMRFGNNYLGHVEANYWGTNFDLYDDGIEEKVFNTLPKYICGMRAKIGTVKFDKNIMGDTPRQMKVTFFDYHERTYGELVPMEPKYDEEKDCYMLNFFGKAKLASARNFILVFPHNPDNVILLHGKAGKDLFNMDFRHPLNYVQALFISIVSIGKKWVVS